MYIMGGSGCCSGGEVVVGKEEVIAKLKDDGDFDKLRLKIVRKLKDNEDLRQHIASIVKQSVTLNSDGAGNMKPRQLSDAIFDEVGDKVMSQISDSLWQIIRSNEGMKTEIAETVQSVYDKLANPGGKSEVPESQCQAMTTQRQQAETASVTKTNDISCENEPEEPPGFTILHSHLNNNHKDQDQGKPQAHSHRQGSAAEQTENSHVLKDPHPHGEDDDNSNAPPGFSVDVNHNHLSDCSDEDPDVPPGFG